MRPISLQTAIAIAAGLAVVALFFFFLRPATTGETTQAGAAQAQGGAQLIAQDEEVGTGAVATSGSFVTVNYTGKLQDGTVFDSTTGRGPFQFQLGVGKVIPGWDQGLQGMKVGGRRLLIIPPSLAYGSQANGPIPANSTLIFDVTLLGVSATAATTTATQ